MELGQYGWNRQVKMFQQHAVFLERPAPQTPNYGVLNLGAGAFDGLSPGHFAGYSGGNYLAFNVPAGEFSYLIFAQNGGSDVFTLTSGGSFTARAASLLPFDVALTTLGVFNIGGGGFNGVAGNFSGAAAGTELAINAASGFGGNLIDAQINSGRMFAVTSSGSVFGFAFSPLSDPAANATFGTFNAGAGTLSGSSAGTAYAAAIGSGFTGNLADWQVGGVSRFSVSAVGNVTATGTIKPGKLSGTEAIDAVRHYRGL